VPGKNEIDHNAGNASGTALIDIHFSQSVSVTGTPTLTLNVGDFATYVSGSGSQDLIFSFTPANSGNEKTTALAITSVSGTINVTGTNTLADTSGADVTLSPHLGVNEPPAPAGTAGDPINLALANPPSAADSLISITFSGVPLDWHLNQGTDLGNGVWSVQTNDVSTLTVTTPSNYTGAVLLHANEEWTTTDGTHVSAIFGDNVEAYAPGSPIFAWSGSDTLTGAGANDLFVFSGPISNDDIYNFNSASDKIDLIGFGGISSFADLHIVDNSVGEATIDLGNGQTITLHGVNAASLTSSDFLFDQTPTTENAGSMVIGDGAMMPVSGEINNTGSIELDSAGNGTLLQIIQYGITLHGAGQVTLSDDDGNIVSGTSQDVTLNNVDNTISGAGQLGAGELDLINSGNIIATGGHSLTIDTGTNVIENSGTLESIGSGGLVVNSGIDNSGLIWANGSNIALNGAVSGPGTVLVDGASTVTFGAATAVNTTLTADAAATLVMNDSIDFSGKISGFDANDHLDLTDMMFASGISLAYVANHDGTGGVLQVSDGAHTANISLLGQYDASNFASVADGANGTVVTYDPSHHSV
jgi:hypothetical protein